MEIGTATIGLFSARSSPTVAIPAGSWGPASFDTLLQEDGRAWIEPRPDMCAVQLVT
jgi:hypothetical protein